MDSHEGSQWFRCVKKLMNKMNDSVHGRLWVPLLPGNNFRSRKKGKCSCPPDVPRGFLAVYAGRERKRFVIPAIYLNHPAFRLLLEKSKMEFGFSQKGGLSMPFEVLLFERFLWLVSHGDPAPKELGVEELEKYYQDKYHLCMEIIHLDD